MKKKYLLVIIPIFIFLLFALVTFFWIYKDVKAACLKAQNIYQKDCVTSLTEFIQSDNHTLREKNTAIWALGQLADKKALPFLTQLKETLAGQEKCNHNQYLCLYEIQKAIKWCTHGNLTSWMYQNLERW